MHVHPRKLEKLKKRLQNVLSRESLDAYRNLIGSLSDDLMTSPSDCAAALLFITQPHLFQAPSTEARETLPSAFKPPVYRTVRYRLNVGSQHQVSEEQVLAVLIEESGVDRKRIARLDMRDTYTLVDLPDGMPADIFQLLTEASIAGHRLQIRRVKSNRRKFKDNKRNTA